MVWDFLKCKPKEHWKKLVLKTNFKSLVYSNLQMFRVIYKFVLAVGLMKWDCYKTLFELNTKTWVAVYFGKIIAALGLL